MTNHKNRWRHIVRPDGDVVEWAAQTRRLGRVSDDDWQPTATVDNDPVTVPDAVKWQQLGNINVAPAGTPVPTPKPAGHWAWDAKYAVWKRTDGTPVAPAVALSDAMSNAIRTTGDPNDVVDLEPTTDNHGRPILRKVTRAEQATRKAADYRNRLGGNA